MRYLKKNCGCASHCGVRLHGVHYTAESSYAVCIIPQSQTAHLGVRSSMLLYLTLTIRYAVCYYILP